MSDKQTLDILALVSDHVSAISFDQDGQKEVFCFFSAPAEKKKEKSRE